MRRACRAEKTGDWEGFKDEFQGKGKFSEWMCDRLKEACEKVALANVGGLSVAQEILWMSIAPVDGIGRSHLIVRLPAL